MRGALQQTDSPPENVSFRNLWRFITFSFPYWPSQLAGIVTGLIRVLLGLAVPWFLKGAIDYVANPYLKGEIDAVEAWQSMLWLSGALLAVMAIHAPATLGRFYFPHRAMASAVRDIRYRLFAHLQRLSLGFHTQRATGGVVARVISDVQAAQQSFDIIFVQLTQQIMTAVVVSVVMFWIDWQWAMVAFAATPIFVVTTRIIRRPMRRATRKQRETVERMSGRVQERFAMIREVQAFTAETYEERQVLDDAEELRRHTLRQRLLAGFFRSSVEITRYLTVVLVVGFGAYRILAVPEAGIEVGDLSLFFMYTMRLLAPLQFFADLYTRMQISAAAADRVLEFFDTVRDITNEPDAVPLEIERPPEVRFENVSFSYPTDEPVVVLDGIDFVAEPGSRVVLVGESGTGKSTMMSLLPRFYDIQDGAIHIGDQDIRHVTIKSLRKQIAVVPQEPVLFSGTIKENIAYGRRSATDEQIREAARQANAERFILELEEGFDTEVGERGVGLSGGQIQRLAIARAFLKDPAILIMDEATSNLDAHSESLVLQAIDRLAQGRTTFIIAHRLSVAREADKIIALAEGKVAETGTHEELLDHGGVYAGLYERQVGVAG